MLLLYSTSNLIIIIFIVTTIISFLSNCSCSSKGLVEGDEYEDEIFNLNKIVTESDVGKHIIIKDSEAESRDGDEQDDSPVPNCEVEYKIEREEVGAEVNQPIPIRNAEAPVSELPPGHPLRYTLIGERWILLKNLDSGCFGDVYIGVDCITDSKVAVKVEVERPGRNSLLLPEYQIYQRLCGSNGFPTVHHYESLHTPTTHFNVLVMDLLGRNLGNILRSTPDRKFALKTVLLLADQMIDRIESLHQCHYIHRDIKPDNFVMGVDERQDTIYLIDFGLAKLYRDPDYPFNHIRLRTGLSFSGTYRYASLASLNGIEQSRRDDLESLGYSLIQMLRGSLPWNGLPKHNIRIATREMKARTSIRELCTGCPEQFRTYFAYVKNLEFKEAPDYKYLKSLFRDAYTWNMFKYSASSDWRNTENNFNFETL